MAMRKRFIDIGANLTDLMFQGTYFNKNHHAPDLPQILKRALDVGLEKIIVTGGSLEDSRKALELAKTDEMLFTTVGVHPTRCLELEESTSSKIDALVKLCLDNPKVVAVGEFGLDYDRLQFCPKEVQLKNFAHQFEVAEKTRLPLFLHCRNAAADFLNIVKENRKRFTTGVVHSFDGTIEEAQSYIDLGLFIGLNGCSLKTEQNLEVVKQLPTERIMIETDCPYCEIKPSHASSKYVKTKFDSVKKEKWSPDKLVKGRNEPCNIIQVLEVIAQLKNIDENQLAESVYENTLRVFFPK